MKKIPNSLCACCYYTIERRENDPLLFLSLFLSLFLRESARQTLEHRADLSTFCVKVRVRDVEKNCGRGLLFQSTQKRLGFRFRVAKNRASPEGCLFPSSLLARADAQSRKRNRDKQSLSDPLPYCRHVLFFFFLCASLTSLFLVPRLVVVRSSYCAKKCR